MLEIPMVKPIKYYSILVGLYAAILITVHGVFELMQSPSVNEGSRIIHAVGNCLPAEASHACWPAFTILHDFQTIGLITIVFGVSTVIWILGYVAMQEKGFIGLLALGFWGFIVGGGFLPAFYIVLSAIGLELHNNNTQLPLKLHALGKLWPWILIAYLILAVVVTIFSVQLNTFLMSLGSYLFLIENVVLVLALVAAVAANSDVARK